jgi:ABC-type polysaccharide/polyol phosphate export permease
MTAPIHLSTRRMQFGLVWAMAKKNFQVRYKRAVLGVVWAVVQPSFQAAFLSFIFLKVFHYGGDIDNYPLYVLSGILPWAFFSQGILAATGSVVENAALVRKVALSRIIFPIAAAGGVGLAFVASLGVLVLGSVIAGTVGPSLLLLVPAVALECLIIVAIGVFGCAFHVAFRDVRYIIESALIVGLYATPILYDLERVPDGARPFFVLNPMTGVMSLYRAAVLDHAPNWSAVGVSALMTSVVLTVAVLVFARRSDEFPDLV